MGLKMLASHIYSNLSAFVGLLRFEIPKLPQLPKRQEQWDQFCHP